MKSEDALEDMLAWMLTIGKSPKTQYNTEREVLMFLREKKLMKKNVDKIDEFLINDYINDPPVNMGAKPPKLTPKGKVSKRKDRRKIKDPQDAAISVATRRYKLSAIKNFLNYCSAKGLITGNPAALVKVNIRKVPHRLRETRKKEAFTPEEIRYMVANTEGFWRAAILIAYETGLRIGDIVQLEWDCFTEDTITVWTDKRDKRVELKMSARLRKTIAAIPYEDDTYVFPEQRNDYLEIEDGGRGTRTWFPVTFKRMMTSFGIEDKTFHCLRVSHASNRKNKGEDIEQIAKDLAHSSSKTTNKHYIS